MFGALTEKLTQLSQDLEALKEVLAGVGKGLQEQTVAAREQTAAAKELQEVLVTQKAAQDQVSSAVASLVSALGRL